METKTHLKWLHLQVSRVQLVATHRAEVAHSPQEQVEKELAAGQVRAEVAAQGLKEAVQGQGLTVAILEVVEAARVPGVGQARGLAQEPAVAAVQEEMAPAREPVVEEPNRLRPRVSRGGSMVQ